MLNFHARKKIKLVMLGFGIFLSCLVMTVGIYAATSTKTVEFGVGVKYAPMFAVKVEIGADKNSDGAITNTPGNAASDEFIEIFNSLSPVGTESFYIQSISNDTIQINSQKLFLSGASGAATFRITALEDSDTGGVNLQCIIDCGSATTDSKRLIKNAATLLTIDTGLDASEKQPTASALGQIRINLKLQEFIPILTSLAFLVVDLDASIGASYADVQSKMNALVVNGVYEDNSQKALTLNTDYTLTLARTDGGGTGAFNTLGTVGTITVTAVSNTSLKSTIPLKITPPPYTVFSYAANTGPIYDNNNSANRYVHYVEMGEYPQRYAGTTSTIAATLQGTYYVDNNDGSKKYALSGFKYYLVEPVKWIVMGVTDGVYEGGTHVLFTTTNKAENEPSGTGLWLYDSATNTFKYRTNASSTWTTATEVLVLSEYGLMRGQFNPSYVNRFSQCQINGTLSTTLYNSLFTANQKTKITPKKMAITTRGGALNSGEDAGVAYNMFLLGSRRNYNGSSWGLYSTDSYNISTYFAPENNGATQGNLVLKETSYSAGSTANSPNGYGTYYWWLRSGGYYYNHSAMYVYTGGDVYYSTVDLSYALRPAFVLNLA